MCDLELFSKIQLCRDHRRDDQEVGMAHEAASQPQFSHTTMEHYWLGTKKSFKSHYGI